MKFRWFTLGIVAATLVAGAAARVSAETILMSITTKFGKGADAEIREEELNAAGFGDAATYLGGNRGASTELATRARTKNADGTFTGSHASAQYMKFDISQLPATSDSWWDGKSIWFRGYTRNANNWRAYSEQASAGIPLTEFKWRLRALDPDGTYSTAQTDQFGNAYTASQYQYDWTEGTGNSATDTSGITAYNAPGRKVYCATVGCTNANGNSLGFYDEFNNDPNVLDLGVVPMPPQSVGNNLPQRTPLTYEDPNGDLTQLVKDAKDAGLDTITLIGHSGPDGTNFATQPIAFLSGQNQLLAPKEQLTVVAAEPNDNANGAYSPQLLVVPEPASLALVCFVGLVGLAARRRQ
jgi:hypothetical protein